MIQLTLHREDGSSLFIDIDAHAGIAYLNARFPHISDKHPITVKTFGAEQTSSYAQRWHAGEIDWLFDCGEITRIQYVGR